MAAKRIDMGYGDDLPVGHWFLIQSPDRYPTKELTFRGGVILQSPSMGQGVSVVDWRLLYKRECTRQQESNKDESSFKV